MSWSGYLPGDMARDYFKNVDAAVREYDRLVSNGVHALEAAIKVRALYGFSLESLARFVLDR